MRVGLGYDIHSLKKGERLILGGVDIPFAYGLTGHSDADVLTHSLIDAILGAMSKGDIGSHFPDTDEKYKGISSLVLLKEVYSIMEADNYRINNVDLVLITERPKIMPYSESIRKNLSDRLNTEKKRVNLKATTAEGLGFVGKEKGMASKAIVSLKKVK